MVVLSDELWTRLGADPAVVGRAIRIGGEAHTVIGVMPPLAYSGPFLGWGDLWVPWVVDEGLARARPSGWRGLRVVGRLKRGVDLRQAHAEVSGIEQQLAREWPTTYGDYTARVRPLSEYAAGGAAPTLLVLLGAVVFILLVACANVANLLLARGAMRQGAMAIRRALGAPRSRLFGLLLGEALILSGLGATIGLGVAATTLHLIRRLVLEDLPRATAAQLDLTVLGAAVGLGFLTACVCALVPLPGLARIRLSEALGVHARGALGGLRHVRARTAIVASQVALAVVLVVGAGLLLRSAARLMHVDPGFRADGVLAADVSLPETRYKDEATRTTFFRGLLDRVSSLPGVVAVGANRYLPLRERQFSNPIFVDGQPVPPGTEPIVHYGGITPGYFRAMGIRLVRGRDFTEREMWDTGGAVIVNEALARRVWPGADALGHRIKHGPSQPWLTVIGIVGDVRQRRIDTEAFPQIYVPYADFRHTTMSIVVRTNGDPSLMAISLARTVRAQDPNLPIFNVMPLREAIERAWGARPALSLLLGLLATVAVSVTVVGLYGVTAYTASLRRRDWAIRVALGASRADVVRHAISFGVRALAFGLLAGVPVAMMLSRSMKAILFEVDPYDPAMLAAAVFVMSVVGLVASYLPAHRLADTDPVRALRQ